MLKTQRCVSARAALLFIATFGATAAQAQQTEGWPAWLTEAMARESKGLKSKTVSAADGQYRFQLAGTATAASAFDGGWYFESDIKSDAPLECYVVTDDTDLATLVVNLADVNIEAQAEATGGPVDNRNIYFVDAGTIDDAPYLALEWMYTVGQAPNALLGFTKVRAAINGDVVQACTHNVLGYRETFNNIFREFVRSAKLPEIAVQPYYEEIAVQSLGDLRIGIALGTYALDDEGDSKIQMTASSLVPMGPGTLAYEDSSTVSWSTPDGRLINSYIADSQNGELVTDLEIGRDDNGDWLVQGTFQGKQLEQVIDGNLQPLSDVGQMQAVRELFASDSTEASFPVWVSDADPTKILQGKVIRDDADVDGQGTLVLGPLSFTAQFAEDGALTHAVMSMGAADIAIHRVWSRGTPQ